MTPPRRPGQRTAQRNQWGKKGAKHQSHPQTARLKKPQTQIEEYGANKNNQEGQGNPGKVGIDLDNTTE